MSESKHTPAPWMVYDNTTIDEGRLMGVTQKIGCDIAEVHGSRTITLRSDEEALANARLIASAPELLEACEMMLAHLEDIYRSNHMGSIVIQDYALGNESQFNARKAIAKARGE